MWYRLIFARILSGAGAKASPYSRYYIAVSTLVTWKHITTVNGGVLARLGKLGNGAAQSVPANTLPPPASLFLGASQHLRGKRAKGLGWKPRPVVLEDWANEGITSALVAWLVHGGSEISKADYAGEVTHFCEGGPHITLAGISVAPHQPPLPAAMAAVSTHGQAQDPDPNLYPDPTVLLAPREAVPLGQRAVHVRFARVVAGDHYFRSIYIAIAPSPEQVQLRSALALAQNRGGPMEDRWRALLGQGQDRTGPTRRLLSRISRCITSRVTDEEAHTGA